ncbi:MAG: hypothetical protein L6U16_14230 [Porphyromonadaceae bacterium]|nr:MAG: hypothetical protein L6U16_14230 [Porphyromonadaceae bacterium]
MILVFLASLMPEYSSVSAQVVNGADIAAVVDSIAGVKPEDKRETTDTSRFKKERVDLDHVVNFTAKDSIVMYGKDNARMFGDGNITYGDIQLTASRLNMDMAKSEVYAIGAIDTSGEVAGNPVFKDKSGSYEAKTMTYNFKSEKGLITDIMTEQGEGYLTGGITKKVSDEDFYIKDAKYTTCDDHEHPHFYFQLTKGKIRPKKDVVTGPAYMVLEDLPRLLLCLLVSSHSQRNSTAVCWCRHLVKTITVDSISATVVTIWR